MLPITFSYTTVGPNGEVEAKTTDGLLFSAGNITAVIKSPTGSCIYRMIDGCEYPTGRPFDEFVQEMKTKIAQAQFAPNAIIKK
jgi:hypothetical protein